MTGPFFFSTSLIITLGSIIVTRQKGINTQLIGLWVAYRCAPRIAGATTILSHVQSLTTIQSLC